MSEAQMEVKKPQEWLEWPKLDTKKANEVWDKLNQSSDPKVFDLALSTQIKEWHSIGRGQWFKLECPWSPVEFKVSGDGKHLNITVWWKEYSWKLPWWAVVEDIKRQWNELIIKTDMWSSNVPINWLSSTLAELANKWSATVWKWVKKVQFALAWK